MSAPQDRLIGDAAAERFQMLAAEVFSCSQQPAPILEELAGAVIALCRDRAARAELQAASGAHKC